MTQQTNKHRINYFVPFPPLEPQWAPINGLVGILRGRCGFLEIWKIQKNDCPKIPRFHARQNQPEGINTFQTYFRLSRI